MWILGMRFIKKDLVDQQNYLLKQPHFINIEPTKSSTL